MIRPNSFFIGAVAGATSAALPVYLLHLPPAAGVIIAVIWGIPAVIVAWPFALHLVSQRTTTTTTTSAPPLFSGLDQDDIIDEPADEPADEPHNRVTFDSSMKAPPGWTNMASMFGGWPQPGQPPQPPQPPRHRPSERVRNGHVASQPVAQPVAQPPGNHLKPDWMADLPGLQGDPGPEPEDRPVPWLNVKPIAVDDADDDDQVLRPLLPRRAPYPGEYEIIYEIARTAPSQNAALRSLWGYKDGRTLAWLKQVLAYYPDYEHLPIWAYEVLTADADADPVAIARRCDHITSDLASLTADLADYNIIPCPSCQRWHEAEQADLDAGILTCETCRES